MPSIREAVTGVVAAIAGAMGVAALSRGLNEEKRRVAATPKPQVQAAKVEEQHEPPPSPGTFPEEEEPKPFGHIIPTVELRPGWSIPEPKELPRPTYWPAVMSLAIIFILWGVTASPMLSGVGLVLFAIALAGWIGELRHETRSH